MTQSPIQPRYLGLADAARYCSVSVDKFSAWINEGRMNPGFYPDGAGKGRRRLWDVADIANSMEAMKGGLKPNEWEAA